MDTTERAAELEADVMEAIGTLVEVHGYSEDDIQRIVKDALAQ
jgi:predicted house-cleaning noncanonical NTP pyrophosphatase (MazG superfamily)